MILIAKERDTENIKHDLVDILASVITRDFLRICSNYVWSAPLATIRERRNFVSHGVVMVFLCLTLGHQ
jgi:hypothetical protein